MSDQSMAFAIVTAMVLIVLAGLLLGFLLSGALARALGWAGTKRIVTGLGLAAFGVVAGVLVVIATFYESTWSPPPEITFDTSPGFTQNWVIVLEDPKVTQTLVWHGAAMPFSGQKASIPVAPHGIVRVQNFGALGGRVDINVRWSDGSRSTSQGGGPAPKSTGATSYSAFNREQAGGTAPEEPPFSDSAALGAYIAARERGAQ